MKQEGKTRYEKLVIKKGRVGKKERGKRHSISHQARQGRQSIVISLGKEGKRKYKQVIKQRRKGRQSIRKSSGREAKEGKTVYKSSGRVGKVECR